MPINLENLSYSFDRSAAVLSGVNIEIADGEFVGITGPAGSGKTTLVQLISGLMTPTGGSVRIDGDDINAKKYDRRKLRRRLGIVMQQPEKQLFESTVERDVAFALRSQGVSAQNVAPAVKEALELLGFDYDTVRERSPLSFSTGEMRRIAIAGVLAAKPGILIFDETDSGLAGKARRDFYALLEKLNRDGATVLLVSHNADALAEYASRVLIMRSGRIIRDNSSKEIFSDYYDLLHNGVAVPNVRAATQLMRERGVDMPGNTTEYAQFVDRLKIIMWRKKR
jgi:energy-coupling factor transport system ATP-binding protein